MQRDPSRSFWNPEIELMSREQLQELQLKKLKKQLKYNYKNSIFYKESFDRANIKPEDILTWKDFSFVPTMSKDDQRVCQEESIKKYGHPYGLLACVPIENIVRLSSTSGTTGTPTLYTLTKHDVQVNRELHARKLWRMGIRPGQGHIALHAFGLSMFPGGVPVMDAFQDYGVCVVPVGAESGVTRVLQYMDLCKPTFLLCTPSFAEYIIRKCPEILGKPATALGLKVVSVGAEPGAGIPEVAKQIKEGFNITRFHDNIGGTHNFHGYSCLEEPYAGMHLVSEDYCVLELLDRETAKPLELQDGVIGEMCYTYIDWEGTPLLRYRLGDMLQVFTSPCKCGDPRLRFKIIGRADDMLIIKGINLYPAAMKNVVVGFVPRVTGEFRILLDAPGPRVVPPLKIQVEYGEGLTKEDLPMLNKEIKDQMHQKLRVTPEIAWVPPNTFERTTHKSKYIMKLYEKPNK